MLFILSGIYFIYIIVDTFTYGIPISKTGMVINFHDLFIIWFFCCTCSLLWYSHHLQKRHHYYSAGPVMVSISIL